MPRIISNDSYAFGYLDILFAWKFKYGTRSVLLFLIPVLMFLVPYLVVIRKNTGSLTGNLDHAAKFYQAAEQLGDPEHLSSLPPLTLREYLFSKNFILKFVPRFLNGYFQILFNPYNSYNRIFLNSHYSKSWNLLLLPFFWLGLFLCLRNDRWFLWLPFFFISGLPFLQDQFREPRLLFHAAPFFSMLSSRGLCAAGSTAASFLKNRRAKVEHHE